MANLKLGQDVANKRAPLKWSNALTYSQRYGSLITIKPSDKGYNSFYWPSIFTDELKRV